MTDHEGQESMAGTRRPIIEVKNLRKEYPVLDETVVALERINLTIPQGQICCIYGESGSGKSTLLNQLAGMEKPTKGGVRIGGVPISRLNERQLAEFRQKHLGFVFQSYNLLPNLTAVENVAMPLMFQGMPKNKREAIAKKNAETSRARQTHEPLPDANVGRTATACRHRASVRSQTASRIRRRTDRQPRLQNQNRRDEHDLRVRSRPRPNHRARHPR